MMREINQAWKSEEGYFTVEASFLVTLVFVLVSAVLLTGLYICDLNQAKSYLNQLVTKLSLEEEDYEGQRLAEDRAKIRQQLFVTNLTDFTIVKSKNQVKGNLTLSMKIDIPFIGSWLGSIWTDQFSLVVDAGNNTDRLRRWEQLE